MNQPQIPTFDPQQQRVVTASHLELVVNALDRRITFEIGSHSGSPPSRFEMEPGDQAQLPKSYCDPIPGANPAVPRPSVLSQLTSCEPYPGGVPIQGVVPMRYAAATSKAWAEAKRNRPKVATVMLTDTEGKPVPLSVPRAHAQADFADPDDEPNPEIEEPPPGAPDLRLSPSDAALKEWAAGSAPEAPPATPATPAAAGVKTVGGAKASKAKD